MKLSLSEILQKVSEQKTTNEKKAELLKWDNQALRQLLKMAYDESIVFNLPKGDPPYKPCDFPDQQAMLYNSMKRMYLFIGDGNPKITRIKKEALFIQLLESLDKDDAKLLLAVKNKRIPYKGINRKLVSDTFPGLLPPPPAPKPKPTEDVAKGAGVPVQE